VLSSAVVNVRAYAYWALGDMLDPERREKLALPPDQEVLVTNRLRRMQHLPWWGIDLR